MGITEEQIQMIVNIITDAEKFRPLVEQGIKAIKSYGSEIEEFPKIISKWLVQNRIESIERYQNAGFTIDQAILMTLDSSWAIKHQLEQSGKKK